MTWNMPNKFTKKLNRSYQRKQLFKYCNYFFSQKSFDIFKNTNEAKIFHILHILLLDEVIKIVNTQRP